MGPVIAPSEIHQHIIYERFCGEFEKLWLPHSAAAILELLLDFLIIIKLSVYLIISDTSYFRFNIVLTAHTLPYI